MILQLRNSLGVYRPLDLFEDFKIDYNHQFEDYTEIGGKKIPYTSNIKIPLTDNNRDLCGVPFDATYPLNHSVEGVSLYTDGTVCFNFVADVKRQMINVLEPYIEISIIDKISKAISELSKWRMSDILEDESFTLEEGGADWMFGRPDDAINNGYSFLFPSYNFNNKNSIFSYDAKRSLCQLQPTFIVGKLVDKMFSYVGLDVVSRFLNEDNQLYSGVKAKELGLMIPSVLKTTDDYPITLNQYFSGTVGQPSLGTSERIVNVPTPMKTSSRLDFGNIWDKAGRNHSKLNYDWLYDVLSVDPIFSYSLNHGASMCSTVSGRMTMTLKSNNPSTPFTVALGVLHSTEDESIGSYTVVQSLPNGTPRTLDVKMVNADLKETEANTNWYGSENYYHESDSYDISSAKTVGKAVFRGIEAGRVVYNVELDSDIEIEFDVEANQDFEFAYVITPPDNELEVIERLNMTHNLSGGSYVYDMIIRNGYIEYKRISGGSLDDSHFDLCDIRWSRPSGSSKYPANITFSFKEATTIPSGYRINGTFGAAYDGMLYINPTEVNMSETMKSVKDYTLLEVLKMIMSRFNLEMFSKSDGTLHLDTAKNRMSNKDLIIDHLIDEGIDVGFSSNENGIISIKDSNPSFYEDGFNTLENYVVSEDKRDSLSVSFQSAIVNDKMFRDVYDGSGYDLLKFKNDTNYWGTADRTQVEPSDLKPTFILFQDGYTPVYFPNNRCTYSNPLRDDEDVFDVGYYNSFEHVNGVHPNMYSVAKNIHEASKFKLVSFEDNNIKSGFDNLYHRAWKEEINDRLSSESVMISVDIYVDENTLRDLMDFPNIKYKGQNWLFLGFNKFPLSNQNGGVTSITILRKDIEVFENQPPSDVENLTYYAGVVNLQLSWDAATDDTGISHYEIWYDRAGIEPFKIGESLVLNYSILLEGIAEGYTHCYKVRAIDLNGEPSVNFSNEVCFTH